MAGSSAVGLPLTTIFTPPTACFWPTTTPTESFPTSGLPYIPDCSGETCYSGPDASCYPTGAATVQEIFDGYTIAGGYAYSPGVLPSGFSTAFSTVGEHNATLVRGCPYGWSLLGGPVCYTVNHKGRVASSALYYEPTTVIPYVAVQWAGRDLSEFTPAAAPAQTTVGMEHKPPGYAKPISTGAKTGIGVGVGIVVVMLLAVGFIVLHRRRKRKRTRAAWVQPDKPPPYSEHYDRPELPGHGIDLSELPDHGVVEIPDRDRGELETNEEAQEFAGVRDPRELPVYERPQELEQNPGFVAPARSTP